MTDSRWGVLRFGAAEWGAEPDIDYRGVEPLAKPDTRLLIKGGVYTTDHGQLGATMTADGGLAYTAASGIGLPPQPPFCFEVVFTADNTSNGYIYWMGPLDDAADRLHIEMVAGALRYRYDTTTYTDHSLPGIDGTLREFALMFSLEPNPATTGSSDAILLTVASCSTASPETWTVTQRAVPLYVNNTGWGTIAVGGRRVSGTASAVYDTASTGEVDSVRVGARAHSSAEFRYDFVDTADLSDVLGEMPDQPPRWVDVLDDLGQIAGPAYVMAGAHHRARRLGYAGPMWYILDGADGDAALDLSQTDLGCPDIAWTYTEREADPDAEYVSHLGLLASPPAPTWATHVVPRITVDVVAGTVGVGDTIRVAMLASDIMPQSGSPGGFAGTPTDRETHLVSTLLDVENNGPVTLVLDPLRVPRDADGHCWLWVAIADPDDVTPGVVIRSVEAVPVRIDPGATPPGGELILP